MVGTTHQRPESESTNKSSFCSNSGSRVLLGLGCEQSLLNLWGRGSRVELQEKAGGVQHPRASDSRQGQACLCRPRADPIISEDLGLRGPIPDSLVLGYPGSLSCPGSVSGFSECAKLQRSRSIIHSLIQNTYGKPWLATGSWTLEECGGWAMRLTRGFP